MSKYRSVRTFYRLVDLMPPDAFLITLNRCIACQGSGSSPYFGECPGCGGEGATYQAFRPAVSHAPGTQPDTNE
jgi:hypothetical protein